MRENVLEREGGGKRDRETEREGGERETDRQTDRQRERKRESVKREEGEGKLREVNKLNHR